MPGMAPSGKPPRSPTCLVVDDDERLRSVISEALASRGFLVRQAGSVKDALSALRASSPDLLVLDVALPDGRALDVLALVAELAPTPRVVAVSGAAGPEESFALAERGVRAYLKKPFNLREFERAVERALNEAPDLGPHLKSVVGLTAIRNVEQSVRTTMVQEALARTKGNRRAAARALQISRELLQHILRKG
jgi:two-component system, response regulator RegA